MLIFFGRIKPLPYGDAQTAMLVGGWEKYVLTRARDERDWKFDSVGDLPRMLRAVGSLNHKTQEQPLCQIEARNGIRYAPEDLEAYISADMLPKNVTATSVPTDDDFALMGTGSGEELVHKCSFLKYYAEHQDEARYVSMAICDFCPFCPLSFKSQMVLIKAKKHYFFLLFTPSPPTGQRTERTKIRQSSKKWSAKDNPDSGTGNAALANFERRHDYGKL